jgi:hypothetical protein
MAAIPETAASAATKEAKRERGHRDMLWLSLLKQAPRAHGWIVFQRGLLPGLVVVAAELDDAAAVALGGAAFRQRRILLHSFTFGGFALALLLAGFGFAIQGLRNGGRTAHIGYLQDFNMKFAALVADAEHVAEMDLARRFGFYFVGTNTAKVAGFGGEGARLEETGGPEPLVDANGVFVLPWDQGNSRMLSGRVG